MTPDKKAAKMKTAFMVECKWENRDGWHLTMKDKNNILWIAHTARTSKERNPFVFKTRKQANVAIRATRKYIKLKKYKWPELYEIFPITINF